MARPFAAEAALSRGGFPTSPPWRSWDYPREVLDRHPRVELDLRMNARRAVLREMYVLVVEEAFALVQLAGWTHWVRSVGCLSLPLYVRTTVVEFLVGERHVVVDVPALLRQPRQLVDDDEDNLVLVNLAGFLRGTVEVPTYAHFNRLWKYLTETLYDVGEQIDLHLTRLEGLLPVLRSCRERAERAWQIVHSRHPAIQWRGARRVGFNYWC